MQPSILGPAIHATVLGVNSTVAFDTSIPGQSDAYRNAGMRSGRWPGGSASDEYDWQNVTGCRGKSYVWQTASFDRYLNMIARPAKLDVEITVNYGSAQQPRCDIPGDPRIAAAWVRYARQQHAGIHWWEVGNEVYGNWETDQHALPHDAVTYAGTFNEFARLMKREDPAIIVGVPVSPGAADASGKDWDTYVLTHAQFDYVDLHYYAQQPGKENDAFLTQAAPLAFARIVENLKRELTRAGHPNAPIDVGEIGSVYNQPGKQTASITQALFAGQIIGKMLEAGVQRGEWWIGNGGCGMKGNMADSLYGWQDFGGFAIFSDDLPTPSYGGCSATAATLPLGTLLPTARVYEELARSGIVRDGEHTIGCEVASGSPMIRAFAASHGAGYGVVLFNLDAEKRIPVVISLDGPARAFRATTITYGKAQYDETRNGTWAAPAVTENSEAVTPMRVSLPPYSMTTIVLAPLHA